MINNTTYIFSHEVMGRLELELESPQKQVYAEIPNFNSCKYSGLKLEEPSACTDMFFFEWQKINYNYIAENNDDIKFPVELRINDFVIKKSKRVNSNLHLISGNFSYKNSVGLTRLELRDASNKLIFSLDSEVFPQKMDYRSDYKAMMVEISQIIRSLTFDTLKDTFRKSKARKSGVSTLDEWWNILDALFESLLSNLGVIARLAKHDIEKYKILLPIEKIREGSKIQNEWFLKNSKYITPEKKGVRIGSKYFSHAPSNRKTVTYDTWENRFVAWAIQGLIKQLKNYRKKLPDIIGKEQTQNYKPVLDRTKFYQSQLQGVLHNSPFNEVGAFEKRAHFSTSLTRGVGYREFMRIYLLLSRGLELAENDIFKIGTKNISTLYEYWCFLKLIQLVKEQGQFEISHQDLIKVKANRIRVELEKGAKSEVKFTDKKTELATTVFFNKQFNKDESKIFTFNQIPDFSISFKKEGFEKPFWYLFDAKYRFDEEKKDGETSFNVPQEAIGQLHRYRDAILHSEPGNTSYRRAIKNLGGVILYPYPLSEETYKTTQYYKSLTNVNIGALPFLPGKTELAKGFLKNLITASPEEHYEQFIEIDRSDYKNKRGHWNDWITIGVVPKKEQTTRLKFLREKRIFHIPFVKDLHSKIYMSKRILACISGSKNALLFNVKNWEILTYKELEQKGATWNLSSSKYIAFYLDGPSDEFETPRAIAPVSYRYSSFEGLYKYLTIKPIDGNYFYLTSPDAARLYDEIKKLNLACEVGWVKSKNDPSLIEFLVGGFSIKSSETLPNLTYLIDNEISDLNKVLSYLRK